MTTTARHVLIDTNVLLRFYHYTNEDLEELRKLGDSVQAGSLILHVPEQVVDEFRRNRDGKIQDAMKDLEKKIASPKFPVFCKEYEESQELGRLLMAAETLHAKMLVRVREDVAKHELKADKTVQELFERGTRHPISADVLNRAVRRVHIGNPPGKPGSHGDAIVWETLLDVVPEGHDLFLASGDGDYASALDAGALNGFLAAEWKERKHSTLYYSTTVRDLVKQMSLDIHLAAEGDKKAAIDALVNSGSFSSTHAAVHQLSKFLNFSAEQARRIVGGAVSNTQVCSIARDSDVAEFLNRILKEHEEQVDAVEVAEIKSWIAQGDRAGK